MSPRAIIVVSPTSPVSIDLGAGGSLCPEMAARAAATTCAGDLAGASPSDPSSAAARIFSAVGVK